MNKRVGFFRAEQGAGVMPRIRRHALRLLALGLAAQGWMVSVASGQAVVASQAQDEVPHPAPTARLRPPVLHCTEAVEHHSLSIPLGQSRAFSANAAIGARTVGNPGVVQAIQTGPNDLYLVGIGIGSTNMLIQRQSGSCTSVIVTVSVDPTGLQEALARLMPEEKGVRVTAAADALVLAGQVSDAVQARHVVELAQHFVAAANPMVSNAPRAGQQNAAAAAEGSLEQAKARVINMLAVAAPQQVMLEVKVAEVSKKLVDELGLTGDLKSAHITGAFGKLLTLGADKDVVNLRASKSEEPVKILAEPNLMAISGQKASFMAGGKVFMPIPQSYGVGNAALVTLQEQSYGVKLTFLPTVLKNDVINLQVSPEVSDLSNTGVQFQYGDGKIQPMPAIDVRSASTTVQLRDGQSFAIGGLLKDSMRGKLDAFPGLGEIPVLGALFRSTSYQSEKTELVFIVTPHLVKPLDGATTLPTDTFGNTSQLKVLATGNMEGDAPSPNAQAAPPAAPAMLSPPVPRAGAGKAKPVQGEVP